MTRGQGRRIQKALRVIESVQHLYQLDALRRYVRLLQRMLEPEDQALIENCLATKAVLLNKSAVAATLRVQVARAQAQLGQG